MSEDAIETVDVIETWLNSTLRAGAPYGTSGAQVPADRIIGTLPPGDVAFPYVVFGFQGSRDVRGAGGTLLDTAALYLVKVIVKEASWTNARAIMRSVNARLSLPGQTVTTAQGNLTSVREQVVQYPEMVSGIQYRHLGAVYRIRAMGA